MGITGELVRSVFSRSRSFGSHESTVRSSVGEKRRWSSVRSYLCGDEFNSVLAEEDSASVKSSEATVTKPNIEDTTDIEESQNQENEGETAQEKHNSTSNLFRQEDAAMTIQLAFRAFLARRRSQESKSTNEKPEQLVLGTESPSSESIGTSVEVQTGDSTKAFSVEEQLMADHLRIQQKARSQVLRLKEDWDDSTVSSNISRMRMQNRLEASTRRERALAYAFSQQLRICAKKKQAKPDDDGEEPNMGWNWLERWMATRIPDSPSFENQTSKQFEPINNNHGFMAKKRFFDITGEERESCGSNELPAQFDSFSVTSPNEKDVKHVHKNRLKATRSVSKRKTVPRNHSPKDYAKVSKNESTGDAEKHKKHKQKQLVLKNEVKCSDNLSEQSPINRSPDLPLASEISKTCM